MKLIKISLGMVEILLGEVGNQRRRDGDPYLRVYEITQQEVHDLALSSDKPFAEAMQDLVRGVLRPGDVGYVVLRLKAE